PQLDYSGAVARGQMSAVGTEDRDHILIFVQTHVVGDGAGYASSRNIELCDCAVSRDGDQSRAIGAEGESEERTAASGERAPQSSFGQLPKLNCLVVTAGSQRLAIGAEGDGIDPVCVLGQCV